MSALDRANAPRRYELLELLGKGGFGRVYRARLEAGTFSKIVAIKVLNDAEPERAVLDRFRDEARILAMVRDRAFVHVDQPTVLSGHWAVVMEYLDGCTAHQLLKHGPLPPRVALQVIGEVARALARAWDAPGPDGRPLRLVHRDLKPGNLQITPWGEVKILDFGIAKAAFDDRAATTTAHVVGSPGYIAPERFSGEDGQPSDVFSLGVSLRVLLTGQKPAREAPQRPEGLPRAEVELWDRAAALAVRMADHEPDRRPAMAEVEAECRRLSDGAPGPDLSAWARTAVPPTSPLVEGDPLLGSVFTEHTTLRAARSVTGPITAVLGVSVAAGSLALALVAAVIAALAIGLWWVGRSAPVAEAPPPPAPEVVPISAPEPVPEVVPEPEPEPAPSVRPRPRPSPRPTPAPVADEPAPAPVERFKVVVTSIPPDAEVFVDGRAAGRTPRFDLELPAGAHQVRLVLGERSIERTITVSKHAPTRYVWKLAEDQWLSGF